MKSIIGKHKLHWIIMVLLLGALLSPLFLGEDSCPETQVFASGGVLDLGDWTQRESGLVTLEGEWSYYPGQLREDRHTLDGGKIVTVPHFWEEDPASGQSPYGFGSYRLEVTGLDASGMYGIKVLDEVTAYQLWVNGIPALANGVVGKDDSHSMPQWKPAVGVFQADDHGVAVIEMDLSNFNYYRGGFWNSLMIGTLKEVVSDYNNHKLLDMFLFASMFIIGISNFIMFFLYRWRYNAMLYFSLFCFTMGSRTMLTGHRIVNDLFPGMNWDLGVRLEYLCGYLLLPLFALFIVSFFNLGVYQSKLRRLMAGIIVVTLIAMATLPNALYVHYLAPYKWMAILVALGFLVLVIREFRQDAVRARVLLVIVAGFLIAVFKEIFIGGTLSWLPFATLNLIVCFSFLTFNRLMNLVREKEIFEKKAIHDQLTGLYNRNYLTALEAENCPFWKQERHRYLMFLDLDSFKDINDTHGHDTGDFILLEVSTRIKKLLRSTDILCRYGGDEFIIIIDELENDFNNVKKVADRIIGAIREPLSIDGMDFEIGASIGITEMDAAHCGIETYIRQADQAMYSAKKIGGNQYRVWKRSVAIEGSTGRDA